MGINLVASDLLYIVAIANRSGRMAVIEDQKVAIFTPVSTEPEEGFRHVGFHIDHVQTVAEALAVLRHGPNDRGPQPPSGAHPHESIESGQTA